MARFLESRLGMSSLRVSECSSCFQHVAAAANHPGMFVPVWWDALGALSTVHGDGGLRTRGECEGIAQPGCHRVAQKDRILDPPGLEGQAGAL